MEDAATAEISRSQLWQWLRHGAKTDTGKLVTKVGVRARVRASTVGTRPWAGRLRGEWGLGGTGTRSARQVPRSLASTPEPSLRAPNAAADPEFACVR